MRWARTARRWDRDVRAAMKGVPNVEVHFSRSMVASCLWDCGEDELAERALTMSADEHAAVQRIAAVYRDPAYPLPVTGQRILNRHVTALAAIAFFEGRLRALARERSRPQKLRPVRFTPLPPDPPGGG